MCLTPLVVRKRTVPCGNCAECRQAHRRAWAFRLDYEALHSANSLFITLTYDDDHLLFSDSDCAVLHYADLRNYFKRLRKEKSLNFRYFAVGEYGEQSGRPHFHVLLFSKNPLKSDQVFREKWEAGHTHIKCADFANIRYCLKDMLKERGEYNHLEKEYRPQIRVSKGLGSDYLITHKHVHMLNAYDIPKGLPIVGKPSSMLPRYYRNKLFNTAQKEYQSLVIAKKMIEDARKREVTRDDVLNRYEYVFQKNVVSRRIRHANKKI